MNEEKQAIYSTKTESKHYYKEFILTSKYGDLKAKGVKITDSSIVHKYAHEIFNDIDIRESFIAAFVDRQNKIIGYFVVSIGGVAGTIVDTKLIFSAALQCLASGIVLMHNHPSGNTKPSQADIRITKKIKEAAKHLDITILDHVIITPEKNYYSFADEGIL